ncbi:MAG TPA: nicotinamide-nucleotide amidohydrolase family protein [Candidatus Sulfomarinibacteraceae bacterium]|nr:nicotinamide-nucleotide amidohydrolase family protein [Candidatus Sulfomarinibacteraceae bacterium]
MADAELRALAERLQGLCLGRRLTVAVAESCTGGLVAAALTDIPGSSGYFLGGVVAYADASKREILGVPAATMAAHGAVSAQVARAMAMAVRDRFGASIAASVTGIAGPGGGSEEKPVGLTYVGVAAGAGSGLTAGPVEVRRFTWAGDREANRRDSARATLVALIELAGSGDSGDRT